MNFNHIHHRLVVDIWSKAGKMEQIDREKIFAIYISQIYQQSVNAVSNIDVIEVNVKIQKFCKSIRVLSDLYSNTE